MSEDEETQRLLDEANKGKQGDWDLQGDED